MDIQKRTVKWLYSHSVRTWFLWTLATVFILTVSLRGQELCGVEVDVLGSQSPIVRTVSVDVKQLWTNERNIQHHLRQQRSKYALREQKKERKKEKEER